MYFLGHFLWVLRRATLVLRSVPPCALAVTPVVLSALANLPVAPAMALARWSAGMCMGAFTRLRLPLGREGVMHTSAGLESFGMWCGRVAVIMTGAEAKVGGVAKPVEHSQPSAQRTVTHLMHV